MLTQRDGRPPLLDAAGAGDAPGWAAEHREELRAALLEHGAVRVRGLGLRDAAAAAAVFDALAGRMMREREPFAPRQPIAGGLYSSSPWPANEPMCMHHELSYALEYPGLLLFACLTAPARGGATGVADAAAVLRVLPADLVARFEREGWLLTRSYGGTMGATIAEAFGTRAAVERYCRANDIAYQWQPDGGLRTQQRRSAVVTHPVSGQHCWFNQIAFLSEWTLDPDVREFLVETCGPDGLPFNTRYGGGEEIGEDVVREINAVYDAATTREPWQAGDLMLVDNVRCAHSREPFEGEREVLVGLAEPLRAP